MMKAWKFQCFKDHRNKIIVIDWMKGELSKKAWFSAKRTMENLSQRKIEDWHKPNPASKISAFNHIYVIRFKDENRAQWRIYGFHNNEKYVFVMTNYGTEKDGKYIPSAADCAKKATECRVLCNSNWTKHVCHCDQGL